MLFYVKTCIPLKMCENLQGQEFSICKLGGTTYSSCLIYHPDHGRKLNG